MKWLVSIFRGLFGWLGKTGSRTAQEAASFAIGQATSVTLEPPVREFVYFINTKMPNVKPGVTEFVEAWYKGKVSDNELSTNLQELGYNTRAIEIIKEARKALPAVADIQMLYRRGNVSESEAKTYLAKLGFSSGEQDKLLQLSKALLSVGDIQRLYLRGEISEAEAKSRLSKLGFSGEQQNELIKLASYIPSVPDFIRMAVREVFTPEIAEKYGLFEDYPEELDKYVKMAGLDLEYAKFYWGAHWELPSITQGFDMFHRGIISRDELKTLLRSLDVMPYWRERLIKLSETPFTRVDVRRMYRLGVLTFEEMIKSYMDIGYSKEKAEKLAEFTAKDATEEERELTKTEVTTLYRSNAISREEAREFLIGIGYLPEHTELILALEDYRKGKERITKIKTNVKKRYVRDFISRNDVMVILSREGIPTKEIEELISIWDIEKEEKANLPTKTEIKRFVKKGIISISEYRDIMKRLGYPEEVINWYVKDLDLGGE